MAYEHYEHEYRLLSRCKQDCEYFLGYGGRCDKHLWAGNPKDHIAKMRELYSIVPEKPEWLSLEQIDEYERRMLAEEGEKITISARITHTVEMKKSDFVKLLEFSKNRNPSEEEETELNQLIEKYFGKSEGYIPDCWIEDVAFDYGMDNYGVYDIDFDLTER